MILVHMSAACCTNLSTKHTIKTASVLTVGPDAVFYYYIFLIMAKWVYYISASLQGNICMIVPACNYTTVCALDRRVNGDSAN